MDLSENTQGSFSELSLEHCNAYVKEGKCPICDHRLQSYLPEVFALGGHCPSCGWGVVATYMPPIWSDPTPYKIVLTGADFNDKDHIRGIAKVAGVNFLQARRIIQSLQKTEPVIFEEQARIVSDMRQRLDQLSIHYRIEPEYPYTEEDENAGRRYAQHRIDQD